jgi:hypothetical protein
MQNDKGKSALIVSGGKTHKNQGGYSSIIVRQTSYSIKQSVSINGTPCFCNIQTDNEMKGRLKCQNYARKRFAACTGRKHLRRYSERQRMACHNFAEGQGWLLLREFWQEEVPDDAAAVQTDDALLILP